MPEFLNPFPGLVQREMTHNELVRAVMQDIAAELEAVHLYMSHMDATSNQDAKKVFYDIALEELVHAGEFTSLLYRLDPISAQKAQEGFNEVSELLGKKAPAEIENDTASGEGQPSGLTVGSLIGEMAES